jgi:hypothetical protein
MAHEPAARHAVSVIQVSSGAQTKEANNDFTEESVRKTSETHLHSP